MFYVNHIYKMENPIKDYPWGSHTGRDHERFLSKFRRFDLQIEL